MKQDELYLELEDKEWTFTYTDHDRQIARGIVIDDNGDLYFARADRNDDFGKAIVIETSGGGIEPDEDPETALIRELKEELGANVSVICKIGVVSDYYNLVHRHNINNYYLCKVHSFEEPSLTEDEINIYHLSTLKMTFEEAEAEYKLRTDTKLGRLIANRELPVLLKAKKLVSELMQT